MSYTVKKGQGCPESRPYAVIDDEDGEVYACHATPEAAGQNVADLMKNKDTDKEDEEETAEQWSERMRAILSTHDICFGLALIHVGSAEMIVEVAERKDQWNMGLKYRPKMRYDAMLFKFEGHQRADFTMTDVNFDLDVYWFDANRQLMGKTFAAAGTPRIEAPEGYMYALETLVDTLDVPEDVALNFVHVQVSHDKFK